MEPVNYTSGCVGQRARGTCCLPFRFVSRVNGEWAEGKEVLIRTDTMKWVGAGINHGVTKEGMEFELLRRTLQNRRRSLVI